MLSRTPTQISPSIAPAAEEVGMPVTRRKAQEQASEIASAETATLQDVLVEIRRLREERDEQARREAELSAMLRRRDEELQRLQGNIQISPSENRLSEGPGERVAVTGEGDARTELGYKLKPDTYDGTVPLREFFSQFDLIARANGWGDSAKTVALASCLRGKARSVLESVQSVERLDFAGLKSKLELRFGESHLSQSFYCQFTNRKQRFGEDVASFGSELERLSHLAYSECPHSVRDKIACAQFVSALSDGFVRSTLQLEGITSLELAVERARAIKEIWENCSDRRGENGFGDTFRKRDYENNKAYDGRSMI